MDLPIANPINQQLKHKDVWGIHWELLRCSSQEQSSLTRLNNLMNTS
jgi:hypothetical protein